jgi:23S rRNA (pseudouridine1915-N3)-methyltransferase
MNIVEVKEAFLPSKPAKKDIDLALAKEAEQMMKRMPARGMIVPLSIDGQMMPSDRFASFIAEQNTQSQPIIFLIGSSYGLSPQIRALGSWNLSFGPMTFPHQMARVMLLEQIYRAYMILNHAPYHK